VRRGGEHDRGRRDGEIGPMVLAHSEDVEADLVREPDRLHEVAQPLLGPHLAWRVSANVKMPISTTAFYRPGV
jgi:hypothetical protein